MMNLRKRLLSYVMSATLVLGLVSTDMFMHSSKAAAVASHGLANPVYDEENDNTTWDCIYFGSYWQEDTNGDGVADQYDEKQEIKWRVLSVDGDDAFLLADKGLDGKAYHGVYESITWESCELRYWLNNTFYNEAFNENEQMSIIPTLVYDQLIDKVSILSLSEAVNTEYGFPNIYGINSKTRRMKATEYAVNQGITVIDYEGYEGNIFWWLMLPRQSNYMTASVSYRGSVDSGRTNVDDPAFAVCPAMHIDLSSSEWEYAGKVNSDIPDRLRARFQPRPLSRQPHRHRQLHRNRQQRLQHIRPIFRWQQQLYRRLYHQRLHLLQHLLQHSPRFQ